MAVYMVERNLPGVTLDDLASAQKAAIETAERFSKEGRSIRYIRSVFVPGESRCLCLFDGPDAAAVKEVNQAAGIPFTRIVEALDLRP